MVDIIIIKISDQTSPRSPVRKSLDWVWTAKLPRGSRDPPPGPPIRGLDPYRKPPERPLIARSSPPGRVSGLGLRFYFSSC